MLPTGVWLSKKDVHFQSPNFEQTITKRSASGGGAHEVNWFVMRCYTVYCLESCRTHRQNDTATEQKHNQVQLITTSTVRATCPTNLIRFNVIIQTVLNSIYHGFPRHTFVSSRLFVLHLSSNIDFSALRIYSCAKARHHVPL